MGVYQVALIDRPQGWQPRCPDDVPPEARHPREVVDEFDDFFPAVRRTIERNETADRGRWAVVVEKNSIGKTWPRARLCTPVRYKVTAIWWPQGWEPQDPLDVPNCVFRAQGEIGDETFSYCEALAAVRRLNRQVIDQAGAMWYVVVAVENEPLSQSYSYDPAGTETLVEIRRLHVVHPAEGGGKGDCTHCPAHAFQCADQPWDDAAVLSPTAPDPRGLR